MLQSYPHNAVLFIPPQVSALGLLETAHYAVDGPDVVCAFQSYWCSSHSQGCGGFDEHHKWPQFLGGPEKTDDKLVLCPTHHRRQHALIRAMIGNGTTAIHTLHYFAPIEWQTAIYAVTQWHSVGMPAILGWSCPAAVVKVAA